MPSGNKIVKAGISCPIGHNIYVLQLFVTLMSWVRVWTTDNCSYGVYNFVGFVETHLITAKERSIHKQIAKSSFDTVHSPL